MSVSRFRFLDTALPTRELLDIVVNDVKNRLPVSVQSRR